MILQPCGWRHLFRLDRKVVLPPAARWQNFGQGLIDLVEAWAWGRGQTCRLILNAWQPPQKGLIGTYFGTQKFDKNEWLTVTKSHYRRFWIHDEYTHTHIYVYHLYRCKTSLWCRGVWHSCPTTRNEAVDMSGKGNVAGFLYPALYIYLQIDSPAPWCI